MVLQLTQTMEEYKLELISTRARLEELEREEESLLSDKERLLHDKEELLNEIEHLRDMCRALECHKSALTCIGCKQMLL